MVKNCVACQAEYKGWGDTCAPCRKSNNSAPAANGVEQVAITEALYEDARHVGLDTVKFLHDGRQVGSGGGNHIVVGAASPRARPRTTR